MQFYETAVHFLSPEVVYNTSMREEFEGEKPIPSRVTLVFLKKGDEWKIVRQHPVHTFELLQPIQFLRTALDIRYCHHEKWDGTGYPRGLLERLEQGGKDGTTKQDQPEIRFL